MGPSKQQEGAIFIGRRVVKLGPVASNFKGLCRLLARIFRKRIYLVLVGVSAFVPSFAWHQLLPRRAMKACWRAREQRQLPPMTLWRSCGKTPKLKHFSWVMPCRTGNMLRTDADATAAHSYQCRRYIEDYRKVGCREVGRSFEGSAGVITCERE